MSRRKLAKLVTFELLQWAGFATPVLVTGVEAAKVLADYWLTVAVMIGYVAVATLLVWIPVKLCFDWLKLTDLGKGKWCHSMFLYVLLSFVPCVVIILVSWHRHYDVTTFQYTAVELMLIMLLVIDWSEKLKGFKLRAESKGNGQDNNTEGMNEYTMEGSVSAYSLGRTSQVNLVPKDPPRISAFFRWGDVRTTQLLYSLLNIYDIRMLLNVAVYSVELGVSPSSWVTGIYVVATLATFTFIPNFNNKYRPFITAVFLDLLFFFLRLSIFIQFGRVTSILFLFKNLFVGSSCVYFGLIRGLIYGESPQDPVEPPNGVITNTEPQNYNSSYDPYELGGSDVGANNQGSPQGYHDNSRGYDGQQNYRQDQQNQDQQNYDQQNQDQQNYDQQNHDQQNHDQQNYDQHDYAPSSDHRYDNNDHYYQDDPVRGNRGNQGGSFGQWENGEFDDDVIEPPVVQSGLKPVKRERSQRATILQTDLYSSAKSQTGHITDTPLPRVPEHSSPHQTSPTDAYFTPPNTHPTPPDQSPTDDHGNDSLPPPKTDPHITSDPHINPAVQEQSSVAPQVVNEPTYSQINKSKKKSKNPAPPPPISQQQQGDDADQITNNAGNSNREMAHVSSFNHVVGPHRVTVRSGHSFTPDIASQIAQEAKRRSKWIEAKEEEDSSSLDVRF